MSFALPAVKSKPEITPNAIHEGNLGVPDLMLHGFSSVKSGIQIPHPLMATERNYHKQKDNLNLTILRNTQGLHAPLRIGMEFKAAKKIGRLPFLPSSNVMLESLTGRDMEFGPEDIFNLPEFSESLGQPHAVIEKSLGLL